MNEWTLLITLAYDVSETYLSLIRNIELNCAVSSYGLVEEDGTRDMMLAPKHLETVQTILALCWQHPHVYSVEIVRPRDVRVAQDNPASLRPGV